MFSAFYCITFCHHMGHHMTWLVYFKKPLTFSPGLPWRPTEPSLPLTPWGKPTTTQYIKKNYQDWTSHIKSVANCNKRAKKKTNIQIWTKSMLKNWVSCNTKKQVGILWNHCLLQFQAFRVCQRDPGSLVPPLNSNFKALCWRSYS